MVAWQTPIHTTLPTSPRGPDRKYMPIAVITWGMMIGRSMNDSSSFFARISLRTNA
jgi:hypothetical protein